MEPTRVFLPLSMCLPAVLVDKKNQGAERGRGRERERENDKEQ